MRGNHHEGPERRQECIRHARAAFAQNRFAEALRKYEELLRFGEDGHRHAHERWICCMNLGDFERAWCETDRTEAARKLKPRAMLHVPRHLQRVWDGSPITDRHVLVCCHHGLGDTIQFIRYIPLLREVAASVTVEVQPALLPLLESFQQFALLIPLDSDADRRHFEVAAELMELPYIFRTWLGSVPANVPYVYVPSELRRLRWLELTRLGLRSGTFNVGLVWSSGDWNPDRNIDLNVLLPIAKIPGVRLFALQRGPAANDLKFTAAAEIVSVEREFGTVLDTAAAIMNLDLVISVDTMVAHLAGALGKPVWTLLPFTCDWRWMADRGDTPWYPTMRLFRQPRPKEWPSVIDQICSKLSLSVAEAQRAA